MIVQGHTKDGLIIPDKPLNLPNGVLVRIETDNIKSDFWENKSIDDLEREQGVKPIVPVEQLSGSCPPDDDIDEFLTWLREARK